MYLTSCLPIKMVGTLLRWTRRHKEREHTLLIKNENTHSSLVIFSWCIHFSTTINIHYIIQSDEVNYKIICPHTHTTITTRHHRCHQRGSTRGRYPGMKKHNVGKKDDWSYLMSRARKLAFPSCEVTCFCLGAKKEDAILTLGYHDNELIVQIKLYFSHVIVCVITWNTTYLGYKSYVRDYY